MNRREFLKSTTRSMGTLLGFSLLPCLSGCKDETDKQQLEESLLEISAGKVSDLQPGEGKSFKFGGRPALIIRAKDGKLLAYDATCPHMECTVHYRPEKRDIYCPCHSGTFDLAGQKVFGPPDKPLTALHVKVAGEEILVTNTKAGQR